MNEKQAVEFVKDLIVAMTAKIKELSDPARIGLHVAELAVNAKWNPADGEGAFEFMQRLSYEQGAEDARALKQPESAGWISVDERLPEHWLDVVVWPIPKGYSYTAFILPRKGWVYIENEANNGYVNCPCKVTHWMPLPPGPGDAA